MTMTLTDRQIGRCAKCHRTFHHSVYNFRHVDPSTKDQGVGDKLLQQIEIVKEELDKCIVVCANCPREIHWKYDDI